MSRVVLLVRVGDEEREKRRTGQNHDPSADPGLRDKGKRGRGVCVSRDIVILTVVEGVRG